MAFICGAPAGKRCYLQHVQTVTSCLLCMQAETTLQCSSNPATVRHCLCSKVNSVSVPIARCPVAIRRLRHSKAISRVNMDLDNCPSPPTGLDVMYQQHNWGFQAYSRAVLCTTHGIKQSRSSECDGSDAKAAGTFGRGPYELVNVTTSKNKVIHQYVQAQLGRFLLLFIKQPKKKKSE